MESKSYRISFDEALALEVLSMSISKVVEQFKFVPNTPQYRMELDRSVNDLLTTYFGNGHGEYLVRATVTGQEDLVYIKWTRVKHPELTFPDLTHALYDLEKANPTL